MKRSGKKEKWKKKEIKQKEYGITGERGNKGTQEVGKKRKKINK